MKKSRYSAEQVAFALRQAEGGTPVTEVCRKMGISEQTLRYAQGQALLSLGKAVCRDGRGGGPSAEDSGRREQEIEAVGGGPESGQADVAGRAQKKTLKPVQRRLHTRYLQVA